MAHPNCTHNDSSTSTSHCHTTFTRRNNYINPLLFIDELNLSFSTLVDTSPPSPWRSAADLLFFFY